MTHDHCTAYLLDSLRRRSDPSRLEGMARFGIATEAALGVAIPHLRELARDHGRDHPCGLALWDTGLHEARILASMIASPRETDSGLMDAWALDFRSWDLCDQCCSNLFEKTPLAWDKALEWTGRSFEQQEFVKRAGFVLMARLAVSAKKEPDERFVSFFPVIASRGLDTRNMVKKGVSWALRQMGKRSHFLRERALACASDLCESGNAGATWAGRDAARELSDPKVIARIRR